MIIRKDKETESVVVIIWGVAGVGKTTIGQLLARELGWKFYEADDFHPAANIEKMKHGKPLDDGDRRPWLEKLRAQIQRSLDADENAVLACSALKKRYRDQLRVSSDVKLVFLRGSRERIANQIKQRRGHFFDPKLLDSQFADLEEPPPAENMITIELRGTPSELVEEVKGKLQLRN